MVGIGQDSQHMSGVSASATDTTIGHNNSAASQQTKNQQKQSMNEQGRLKTVIGIGDPSAFTKALSTSQRSWHCPLETDLTYIILLMTSIAVWQNYGLPWHPQVM